MACVAVFFPLHLKDLMTNVRGMWKQGPLKKKISECSGGQLLHWLKERFSWETDNDILYQHCTLTGSEKPACVIVVAWPKPTLQDPCKAGSFTDARRPGSSDSSGKAGPEPFQETPTVKPQERGSGKPMPQLYRRLCWGREAKCLRAFSCCHCTWNFYFTLKNHSVPSWSLWHLATHLKLHK